MSTFLKAKLDKLDGQKNEQSKITKHLSLTKSINENFVWIFAEWPNLFHTECMRMLNTYISRLVEKKYKLKVYRK